MLSTYITQTRRLIRDRQGLFVPDDELTAYINEARRDLAMYTGCIRRLIAGGSTRGGSAQPGQIVPGGVIPGSDPLSLFQTMAGVERYPYVGFANPYVAQPSAGVLGVCDVIGVAVSWGGAFKPALDWKPWEEFQAWCRVNQLLVTSYPSVFSIFNDGETGEVWMFPVPQTSTDMDWDVFCTPIPLYSDGDVEALPPTFSLRVQYGAAMKVFEQSRLYGSAQRMWARFVEGTSISRVAADRGKTPTHYPIVL